MDDYENASRMDTENENEDLAAVYISEEENDSTVDDENVIYISDTDDSDALCGIYDNPGSLIPTDDVSIYL